MDREHPSVEDELRREIALRRAIEGSMLAGVSAVDREGVQIHVNAAFARMLGWTVEELVGARPPYVYWPAEEMAAIDAAFAATLRGEAPERGFELRFRRKDETRFDALVLISPLREGGADPSGWLACVYDITDRKNVERRLRLEQERLHLAMGAGRLGAWEWEIDAGRVTWSRELEALHGLAPGTFDGSFEAFQSDMHPDDRPRVLATIQRALADASADYRVEYRIVLPDGAVRWLEARGRVVRDGSGTRMLGVCGDVTERRRLEDLQRLLADAGAVLTSSLDVDETLRGLAKLAVPRFSDFCAVHLLDEDGSLRAVELAHADPRKEQLAREIEARWPAPPDASFGRAQVARTRRPLAARHVDPRSFAAVASSEEHRDALLAFELRSVTIVPLEARDRVLGTITFATDRASGRDLDVADLTAAERLAHKAALAIDNARLYEAAEGAREQAEAAARRLRLLAEASATLASAFDEELALAELARLAVLHLADYAVSYIHEPDGSIRRVGLAHRDPGMQSHVEDLAHAGAPRIDDLYGAGCVIRTGQPILATEIPDEVLERGAQNERHLAALRVLRPRTSIVVPLSARGRTLGALTLAGTDASARRYGEEDLLLALELAGRAALLVDNARLYREAQDAVRARDEMVAAVSHDLRNPLQIVRASTSILAMPDLSADKHARAVAAIGRASQQMEQFASELLDVARIDAGRLPLQRGEVDLGALVAECGALLEPIAQARAVELVHALPDGPALVRGDGSRLRQVIANIVGNAVELVPSGGRVSVRVERRERDVRVVIEDSGPGIAEEHLPRLFERFWQADASGRRGTGLGLSIAKGIVDAHGGSIAVRSEVGVGSTFVVSLPARCEGA